MRIDGIHTATNSFPYCTGKSDSIKLHTGEDPDYTRIADRAAAIYAQVDAAYTDHFLTQQQQVAELSKL